MRVIDMVRVAADTIRPHPQNWRSHPDGQRTALRAMLREIGFADVLLGRRCRDEAGEEFIQLLDGHLRREEMAGHEVPVVLLDLTDEEAAKLLITLDPLAAMSEADPGNLRELMESIQTEDEDVAGLVTLIAEQLDIIPAVEPEKNRPPKSETQHECPACGYTWSK